MRVLLTGATGAFGPAVFKALVRDGHDVRLLLHNESSRLDAPSVFRDIRNKVRVCHAMRGIDAVVHLAALLHIVPSGSRTERVVLRAGYREINVEGTANIVHSAAGRARVIYASTIAAYGNRDVVLDELSTVAPPILITHRARSTQSPSSSHPVELHFVSRQSMEAASKAITAGSWSHSHVARSSLWKR